MRLSVLLHVQMMKEEMKRIILISCLAAGFLQQAAQTVNKSGGDELVALEIRSALDEIGKVVGAVFTDDVLERIFSRFCIGK